MKVSLNLNQPNTINNVNFEGYKPIKSKYGDTEYEFNYVYDDENWDCYVELFAVKQDADGNYISNGILENADQMRIAGDKERGIKLESGKATRIDLAKDYHLAPDEAFAYHYKLYPKGHNDAPPVYKLDAGMIINESGSTGKPWDVYNIVPYGASTVTKGGAMKLIIPDNHNISWVYDKDNNIVPNKQVDKARKSSKNFANKIGGSLAGIEKDLDEGKLDDYRRVITTPLFTDDSLTAHAYWNKNCFQMAQTLGNINNYISVQKKMFAKGINLVSDGAYVNEGLEGVHFQHILKWGERSPYFNWFKISGLQDSPLRMGVFGKKTNHVTHRIVNSKYNYESQSDGTVKITANKKYDSKAPTYIQIYDDRLVNADNLSDKELIKAYDKLNTDNHLEINNHNDTVVPYSFRVDSDAYKRNVEILNEYNKSLPDHKRINYKSGEATRMLSQFEYFGLGGKQESGFETWDANPDIAKLNYVFSHSDTKALKNIADPKKRADAMKLMKRKNMEVQDYAVSSAKYWTNKTNQILNLNAAQHLRNIDGMSSDEIYNLIESQSNGKVFPKDLDVTPAIVKNVLRDRYNLAGADTDESYKDIILKGLMDVPLDSVEVGDDIVSVLSSPLVSKRAVKEDQIGVSRFEMYQTGNQHLRPDTQETYDLADKMYTKEMLSLAKEVLDALNTKLPEDNKLNDENGNATQFGKYVIPLLTAEIAKFAIIKGVNPNTEFSYNKETGEITYPYKDLKNTSLLGMGIIADSPEDEAKSVIKKIQDGISHISGSDKEKLASALWKSIKGTNADSFKLAEMIVDRAEAGLDWRIDATKDIGDIESVRNKTTDFEYTWDKVIDFWSRFTEAVKESHPDAYIAAEVTDEVNIYDKGYGSKSGGRYSSSQEAVKKLLTEAGFTTTVNYSYFSSDITKIFGKLFDYDGQSSPDKGLDHDGTILDKLVGSDNYLNSAPLYSLLYSYTFAGNHDKCRILEGFAMDMDFVHHADLTEKGNPYRERAYRILNGVKYGEFVDPEAVQNYNYNRVSNIALAKSESIASGMGKAKEELGLSQERKDYIYGKMVEALKNLTNNKFKGEIHDAEGFGTKPYDIALDIVLDEMDYLESDESKKLTAKERHDLKEKSFERIVGPAASKALGVIKFLSGLVGNPTLFDGDDLGATGFETTSKNIYLQNRNVVHDEWAESNSKDFKPFIKIHKDYIDYQMALRARPELEALNDGAPFALDAQQARYKKELYNDPKGYHNSENLKGYEEGDANLSTLLRQSPNGAMTITVFNTKGLNHEYDEYYEPAEITMDKIKFHDARGGRAGLQCGIRQGLKFVNANNPKEIYYTRHENGEYFLKRHNPETGHDEPIKFKDTTLVLYHQPSFTGRRKVMYNPQYSFTSNPYQQKPQVVTGSKLALTSK